MAFCPQSPFRSKTRAEEKPRAMIRALGYPILFHGVSLGVFFALGLYAAYRHLVTLLIFSLFFLTLGAVSWIWSRRSMLGISLKMEVSRTRAFPDESIGLVFHVTNRKRIPLPWLEIEQAIPYRLATGSLRPPSPYSKERLRWTTAISGRQSLKWRYDLVCRARGDYRLGPARLRSGDMFGLFPKETIIPQSESILVYPKIVPLGRLNLALRDLIGEIGAARSLYEDMNRPTGPRDYRHHDPFNRIHWKATARQGRLHVRQFDASTGTRVLLLLDVHSYQESFREEEETFELAVSTAASLANELLVIRRPMGLLANSSPEIQIPVSSDRGQLLLILEALARVRAESGLPIHDLLERERAGLHPGTTLVIITPGPTPPLAAAMMGLRKQGYPLLLVNVGNGLAVGGPDGIPAFGIPCADVHSAHGEASP